MKNKKYVLMIAGAMSILQCFAAHAGIWAQDDDQWKYQKDDGTYAEYEWVQDSGDWYYCSRCVFCQALFPKKSVRIPCF